MNKNQLLAILIFAIAISGCVGPNKINKWVAKHYDQDLSTQPKVKSDYLSVTSPLVASDIKPSEDTKQTKNFLPLLFYWHMDYLNTCTLNAKLPINTFISSFQTYANSKGLKQKLNGQKLQLSIDSIPNMFVLYDNSHMIWVVYAYGWDNISFRPNNTPLVVSYKITNNNTVVKSGTVTLPNTDKILDLRFFQSIKKATDEYLDQYDENIQAMSRKVVDNIVAGL